MSLLAYLVAAPSGYVYLQPSTFNRKTNNCQMSRCELERSSPGSSSRTALMS